MKSNYTQYSHQPLLLSNNRVWRTYFGGKKIEEWQGLSDPKDGELPEEWIASTIKARNTGREHLVNEGLSKVVLEEGTEIFLKELIESNPEAFLGTAHVEKYGCNTGVLVKILDSSSRLSIQVHPDVDFAQKFFNSKFGKTEAWYVLGGRTINGEPPFLLFGFKPGITKQKWHDLFMKQDIQGMMDSLHRIPLESGSIFLIEGGLPHAIGSGCLLVEIQEPTDYTIRVERTTPEGKTIPDAMCHQGIGFEKIFDCFHYEGLSLQETLNRWRISPVSLERNPDYQVTRLIGPENTKKFSLHRILIRKTMQFRNNDGIFSILIVTSGSGKIIYHDRVLNIHQASLLFLPAELTEFSIESYPGPQLELIHCLPPD
ncbi:MAG TPA: mannose-6-phosphate isomerase [Firmicutes bacterium]|jgi:mannose-6-phosphate isomerase|nr:mannose-6-phosphate isomerase [Bacillota bacterium]